MNTLFRRMSPLKQKLSWVVMEMVGNEELQLSHLFSVFPPKMFIIFIKSHKQSNGMNIFLIRYLSMRVKNMTSIISKDFYSKKINRCNPVFNSWRTNLHGAPTLWSLILTDSPNPVGQTRLYPKRYQHNVKR